MDRDEIAISCEGLGKRYNLGLIHHDRISDALVHSVQQAAKTVRKLTGRGAKKADPGAIPANELAGHSIHPEGVDHIWALRNTSFEVEHGEAVGIIGHNGAGKSTLLKILTGITEPTEGRVSMRGRVASLLEVGTGFHPELTGRENIYMNGAMLGMSRGHINDHFEQIVEFSEVATFIDTPVKRYSSGMYVRLAFAVAAHLEPEILLVDEVLAVGDLAFQKKCLGKMSDVARSGRTILFVSHNMAAISNLTRRCIYMHTGQVKMIGTTDEVVQQYYRDAQSKLEDGDVAMATESFRRGKASETLQITAMEINGESGRVLQLPMFDAIKITMVVKVERAIQGANATIRLKNEQGAHVVTFFSWDNECYIDMQEGANRLTLDFKNQLTPGKYFCDLGINQTEFTRAYDVLLDYPLFEIVDDGKIKHWPNRPFGAVHQPGADWTVQAS